MRHSKKDKKKKKEKKKKKDKGSGKKKKTSERRGGNKDKDDRDRTQRNIESKSSDTGNEKGREKGNESRDSRSEKMWLERTNSMSLAGGGTGGGQVASAERMEDVDSIEAIFRPRGHSSPPDEREQNEKDAEAFSQQFGLREDFVSRLKMVDKEKEKILALERRLRSEKDRRGNAQWSLPDGPLYKLDTKG
jgi:hypothetical protein